MKILRISLRNIASLEGTHTVDFTLDPLRAAGLFAISGITGSGKSTLLDALCLALYERTPRLNAVRGAVKLADGADSISQRDPANLLRRGTGEGFAEVAFVGVDGATYTARWTVRRARGKADGALQQTEMALFRGDVPGGVNGTLEQGGRKTEVLPVIAAKVGLSFEQFTRAVLLAQNDFATFLKADDRERAEILQALTGTGRFEAISIAVFARSSAEQRAVDDLAARLAGNAPLAPEARAEAEAACASAEKAWSEAGEQVAAREAHAAWFQRLAELSRQAAGAADSLREKVAARDAAAPRRLALQHTEEVSRDARPLRDAEQRLRTETAAAAKSRDAATQTEEAARRNLAETKQRHTEAATAWTGAQIALENARPHLLTARELDAKLSPLAEHLAAATRDLDTAAAAAKQLTTARDVLRDKRAAAENELRSLTPKRDALAPFAPFASDSGAWLHRLDHAAACRRSLDEATATLALRENAEKTATAAAAAERANESTLRAAAKAAAATLAEAEAHTRAHDGEKIARARSEADAARTALRELEKHLHDFDTVSAQAAAVEREVAGLRADNEADSKPLAELREQRIPNAERASEAARRAFDLAEAAVTDEAMRLREKLVPSHPCPVCGSTHHPHAAHPPSIEAAALRALRADAVAKDAEVRQLRERAAGLAATCKARRDHEAEKSKALAGLRAQIETLRAQRHDHPAAGSILALPPAEQAAALVAQLSTQQQTLTAAEAADASRRAAEKIREERRTQHDHAGTALDALEKRLAKFAEELTGLRVAREAATATRAEAEKAAGAALGELRPIFHGLPEVQGAWDRDAAALRKRFADETAALLALDKRLGELNAILRETDAALTPAGDALARAESDCMAKRSAEAAARAAHETVRTQRAGIFAGRAADAVEAELTEALRRAADLRDQRAGEFDKADKQLLAATESLKGASTTLAEATNRQNTAGAALDAWLAGFATRTTRALDRAELETVLARDEVWIRAERSALDAMEGAIRTAEGALAVHQRTLDEHAARRLTTEDEPTVTATLAALRGTLGETVQRRDAARLTLHADDQRLRENALLAAQLNARRALADPWLKLNELIGSADGAKFRGIAQRRTLDILLGYANAQLDQLAARYRLERLPESLNLIVVDRDMGDERRSVHSLSGGESFLVSLALALALASLTSNRLRIESLFIDEGFGSLDPETLNTAMNALMHLEAQGRKVGVISHVSEMTDAIPVQIRVIKGRSGASRLIVPGAPMSPDADAAFTEDPPSTQPSAEIGAIASQILAILHREQAAGRSRVSTRALREEIGCDLSTLNAARETLPEQVRTEGRSLSLA